MEESANRSESEPEYDATGAGPGAGGTASADLVEPEGVNAASREITDERTAADVISGGAPERAQDQIRERHEADEMAGTPSDEEGSPGQQLSVGEG
jgi:hypothetical protein